MYLPPTIQLIELLWTISAVPGLIFWILNFLSAWRSRKAVKLYGGTKSMRIYANFAIESTLIMIYIEVIMCSLGVLFMIMPNVSTSPSLTKNILAITLISVSVSLSYKAFKWQLVDRTILGMGKK